MILILIYIRGRRPLRLQQMYYAALDAFVGLELYERLHQLAEEKGISSDRFSSTILPFKHLLNVREAIVQKIPEFYEIISQTGRGGQSDFISLIQK